MSQATEPANVKEIVAAWLEQHEFEGLCNDDCGCKLNDLMPCEFSTSLTGACDCVPGFLHPGNENEFFVIRPTKPAHGEG